MINWAWWSSPKACPSKIRTKSTMVWKEKRRTHPMEISILRLTRAVQTTSVTSTPRDVSGPAMGQGNHAEIFVDLRLCGDRSACRVLTPPSAPAPTVLTLSSAFGMLLRWLGTVLGRTKCANFFVKTYCLWHKQVENEIISGGHCAPFFRKWARTLLFSTFLSMEWMGKRWLACL